MTEFSSFTLCISRSQVFNKVKYMDNVDLETFFEAAEDWNSAMAISNSMAFISQFGGAFPVGSILLRGEVFAK